jgi:hypothetical protein
MDALDEIKELKARIVSLESLFCKSCLDYFNRKGYDRSGCYRCDLGSSRHDLMESLAGFD